MDSGNFFDVLYDVSNWQTRVYLALVFSGKEWTTMELCHCLGAQHPNISYALTALSKMGFIEKTTRKKWVATDSEKIKPRSSPLFIQGLLTKKEKMIVKEDGWVEYKEERAKFFNSPEWQNIRDFILERDENTCQRCGAKNACGIPFNIHHVISYSYEEYRLNPENLVSLCKKCHKWVHSDENKLGEFLKKPVKKHFETV